MATLLERDTQTAQMSQIDKIHFIKLAASRNEAFNTQSAFIPRDPLKEAVVDGLGWWFFKDARLVGEDNLIEAQELSKNLPLTLTPNHNSDGDHEGLVRSLTVNGHKEFARKLGFIAGWKMIDRWYIKMFMGAQPAFLSVAPGDLDLMKMMRTQMETSEEIELWKQYFRNTRKVSTDIKKQVKKWEGEGNPTVLYVQGGRLKSPYEIASPPEVMKVFLDDERIITPINSKGISKLVTAEKIINPFKRGTIQFEVGKPYHTDTVKELLEDRVIRDAGINAVDIALARILLLSPFLPHPQKLSEEFKTKLKVLEYRDPYMQIAA